MIRWAPATAWMLLIFSFSTEIGSPQRTSGRFEPFVRWFLPEISKENLDFLHFLFRKGGHLTEYAILAALVWWALGSFRHASNKERSVRAFIFSVFYAATDEFHQSFVPTRGAAVTDVMIDAVGAALALTAIAVVLRLLERRRPESVLVS